MFLSSAVLKAMSMEFFHQGKAFTCLAHHNIHWANKKLYLPVQGCIASYLFILNLVYCRVMGVSLHSGGWLLFSLQKENLPVIQHSVTIWSTLCNAPYTDYP